MKTKMDCVELDSHSLEAATGGTMVNDGRCFADVLSGTIVGSWVGGVGGSVLPVIGTTAGFVGGAAAGGVSAYELSPNCAGVPENVPEGGAYTWLDADSNEDSSGGGY